MWWGIAIEASDPGALAAFYSELLGWTIGVFAAMALGATLAEHQPQANVRVLLDPAGHPFCLCLDEE
ncbi:hypothetical protein BH24ACT6_BH24ACT6_16980 [soil metagenome]